MNADLKISIGLAVVASVTCLYMIALNTLRLRNMRLIYSHKYYRLWRKLWLAALAFIVIVLPMALWLRFHS